jgi:FAD/FMN-containing dehydrogenase
LKRRELLRLGAGLAASLSLGPPASRAPSGQSGVDVYDLHTHTQHARVRAILRPTTPEEVSAAIQNHPVICPAGRLHSSGGQQLLDGACLLDTRRLRRILACDAAAGHIDVEAGVTWPDLISWLRQHAPHWTIRQKQTVNRVTLGGSLSANAHGNTLGLAPLSGDILSLDIMDADGNLHRCSRGEPGWFSMAAGGYGMAGVITALRLALRAREKLRALAEFVPAHDAPEAFARLASDGARLATMALDTTPSRLLQHGVLRYALPHPAGHAEPLPSPAPDTWLDFVRLLHDDRARTWEAMCAAAVDSAGHTYHADDLMMSDTYLDGYHAHLGAGCDPIAEFMVPATQLPAFLEATAAVLREASTEVLLAEVRVVEADHDTVLTYAPQRMASLALMAHIDSTASGTAQLDQTWRAVLDAAIALGGTFHPAFGRFATPAQMRRCLPWEEFVRRKQRLDPRGRFRSAWYDAYGAQGGPHPAGQDPAAPSG